MLYFLYGSDKDKARKKAGELVAALQKKKPDAAFFKLNDENWNEGLFDEYLGGQGLFENKYIILADGLFSDKSIKEFVVKKCKDIKESSNIFIFREGELDKTTLSKVEKNAEKVQEFNLLVKSLKKEEFKIFTLTDALGRKDKKGLWILYSQAKNEDVADEQIHGILFWQIKNMILASSTNNAKEAGLNPFVYSKALGFARNFSHEELIGLSSGLVSLYHEARQGKHDLDTAFEKWILEI